MQGSDFFRAITSAILFVAFSLSVPATGQSTDLTELLDDLPAREALLRDMEAKSGDVGAGDEGLQIEQLRDSLEDPAASELTADEKARLTKLLDDSAKALKARQTQADELETSKFIARNGDMILDQLAATRAVISDSAPGAPALAAMPPPEIQALQSNLGATQDELLAEMSALRSMQTRFNSLSDDLSSQLVRQRRQAEQQSTKAAALSGYGMTLSGQVEKLWSEIQAENVSQNLYYLREKLRTIPALQRIVAARIALTRSRLAVVDSGINRIGKASRQKKLAAADVLAKHAINVRDSNRNLSPASRELVVGNPDLAETLRKELQLADSNAGAASELRDQIDWLTSLEETVEAVSSTGQLGDDIKSILLRVEEKLPSLTVIVSMRKKAEGDIAKLNVQKIIWTEQRRQLDSNGTQISADAQLGRLPDDPAALRLIILDRLLDTIDDRRQDANGKLVQIQEIEERTRTIGRALDELLAWTPTESPLSNDWLASLTRFAGQIVDRTYWRGTAGHIVSALKEGVWLLGLVILVTILLIRNHSRFIALRRELDDRVGRVRKDATWITPASICLTLLSALPIPLFATVLGLVVADGSPAGSVAHALGKALWIAVLFYFFLSSFWKLAIDGSVFDLHFRSPESTRRFVIKNMRWLTILQAIAIFVFAYSTESGNPDLERSIGLIAFMLISFIMSVSLYYFFHVSRRLTVESIERPSRSIVLTIISTIIPVLPLVIGFSAFFGYFRVATQLQFSILMSGVVLLGAAVLYGILQRALGVIQHRAAYLQLPPEQRDDYPEQVNFTVDSQSDRILKFVLIFLIGVALVGVWHQTFPVLGILDEINLWSSVSTVDGESVTRYVTAWDLLFAGFVILTAAFVIKCLSELVLAQARSIKEQRHGGRYALFSLANYVVAGGGALFVLSYLGINWGDIQWIVAALGVGLGFGLQEIMANFVSGIIILFERPVRVGDMVTIGEVTGTVENIKTRATTIRDFDNREVVLPNKSIITENVVNWTLNNQVTRLVVPIGVAYGSDIALVSEILTDISKSTPGVLEDPAPLIVFVAHGDSALQFEIRLHIDQPDRRMEVLNRINSEVNGALAKANIVIPFPQHDIHIISMPQTNSVPPDNRSEPVAT